MTSILSTIYDQLEGLAVSYVDKAGATVTPVVYSQETFLDNVQTAHLPARILYPAAGSQAIGPGGLSTAEWRISDLFLLEASAQGTGSREQMPQITRYSAAYAEKIGTLWQLLTTWHTEDNTVSVQFTPANNIEFPAGSGSYYYGVRCDLTVTEII